MNLLKSLLLELDNKTQFKEKFIDFIEKAGYKHYKSSRIVTYLPGAGAANPNVREITLKDYSKGTVAKIQFYKKVIRVLLTTNNKLNKAKGLVAPGGTGEPEPSKLVKQNYKTAAFDKQLMSMLVDFDFVFSHLESGRVEVFKPGQKYSGNPQVRYISLKKYGKGTVAKVRFVSNKIIRVLLTTANKVEKLRGLLAPEGVKGSTAVKYPKTPIKKQTLSNTIESNKIGSYLKEKSSDDYAIEFGIYLHADKTLPFKHNFVAKGVRFDSTNEDSGVYRVTIYGNSVRIIPYSNTGGIDISGKVDIKVVSKLTLYKAKKALLDMKKQVKSDKEIEKLLSPVPPPPIKSTKPSPIVTNESPQIAELIENKIKKQCSIAWMAFVKGKGIARGVREGINGDYAFVKHLDKRKPKDSRIDVDNFVEKFRAEHFPNVPSRQFSAYGNMYNSLKVPIEFLYDSSSYGRIYLVFPVNGTSYFQSNKIDDFYHSTPYHRVQDFLYAQANLKKFPDLDNYKKEYQDRESRMTDELSMYFKDSNNTLQSLKADGKEVLFTYTKGYYIIDRNFKEQVAEIARQ